MNEHDYKHFGTVDECDTYLRNNRHIRISHLCCGGKGYAIRSKKTICPPAPIKAKKTVCETSIGTCDICFVEGLTLHHTCTSCKQPFCLDCLEKLPTKKCPCCRSPLK
jgi:hypothetical protein